MKVIQVQDTSKGIPIYKIPVIIKIVTPEKNISERVWIKKKEQIFEFSVEEKPLMVRFDEGNYLLKEWTFEKSLDDLLFQLKNYDVIGRSWAASELIKYKDNPSVVNGLIDRAKHDTFWVVRRSAVEILGKIKRQEDVELFKEKGADSNSKVRTAALRVLEEYKNPELVSFFKSRFKKDDSYLAQAEALRTIGKYGDREQLVFLENAAKMKSPRNVIKRAAEWAMEVIIKKRVHKQVLRRDFLDFIFEKL